MGVPPYILAQITKNGPNTLIYMEVFHQNVQKQQILANLYENEFNTSQYETEKGLKVSLHTIFRFFKTEIYAIPVSSTR